MLGGAPLKVVTVFNDKPTFKLYVKKQFRRFSDLKGAKLGSTTPGSTNDRLLKLVLEKNGLDWRKDLSLIYIGLSPRLFIFHRGRPRRTVSELIPRTDVSSRASLLATLAAPENISCVDDCVGRVYFSSIK